MNHATHPPVIELANARTGEATPLPHSPIAPAPERRRFQRADAVTGRAPPGPLTEPAALVDAPVRAPTRDRAYRGALVAADSLAALAALAASAVVLGENDALRPGVLLVVPIIVAMSKLVDLYDRDELLLRKTTLDEAPRLLQVATSFTLVAWLLEGILVSGELSARQILGLWGSLFVLALAGRVLARRQVRRYAGDERCLVVGDLRGTGDIGARLHDGGVDANVVANLPLDLDAEHDRAMTALRRAIIEQRVHRVILAPRTADSDAVLDALRLVKSLGVKVSLLPRLFEVVGTSVVFDEINGVTLLGVRRFGLTRSSAAIKRAMDVAGAALGLVALAPIMAFIAILIRTETPGPLFFRQTRVGRDGRCFEILKFRSMIDGADALKAPLGARNETHGLFKISDDPRTTRVGKLLRAASLDEIPQLLNVLRGDMSLVGPRPLVVDEDALVAGWHRRRLHLTPGMTGPWQILGATRVPLGEMVKIDYLYIANWSLWTDLKILLRTVLHVIRRSGL